MKIGILTQYYPPEIGAPQARLSELAVMLADRGHEIFVLTAMPSYPQGRVYPGFGGVYRKEIKDGYTVIRTCAYPTKSVSMLKRLTSYFSFVGSSFVCGTATLPRLDYLLVESPPLFLGISGWMLSRLKRARMIFNVSDLWPETAIRLGVLQQGWKLTAAEWLERWCYRNSWMVSGQSREIVEAIGRICPGVRTFHLSNGVNTESFNPSFRSEKVRAELGFEGCVALYSGLHGIAQGLLQVLSAAEKLKDVNGLMFAFIGDGPDKEMLMAKAADMGLTNVRFLRAMPKHRMPEIVSSADIGLVPLKIHLPGAVPSKVYEYMGSGLPVVMAADGEPARIVNAAKCGVVVKHDDSVGMATAIRDLVLDSERRHELARNGRLAVERFHDRTTISRDFALFIEKQASDQHSALAARATAGGR